MPFDPNDPESNYRELHGVIDGLRAEIAAVRHDQRLHREEVTHTVRELSARRRFKIASDRGPGSVDSVLLSLMDLLERMPKQTAPLSELRQHVDRNRLRDAIDLGAEKGLLAVGTIVRPMKGQPPQVVTLASNPERPYHTNPDGYRIRWEDEPLPEGMKPYKRKPRTKHTRTHKVTVKADGRVSVTKDPHTLPAPSEVELTTLRCQHFPNGIGQCQDDCLAIFGSVFPPYEKPAEPAPPVSDWDEESTSPVVERVYADDVWLNVGKPSDG